MRTSAIAFLLLMLMFIPACTNVENHPMGVSKSEGVSKSDFGKTQDGKAVELYTLTNGKGMKASVMTYGATLVELDVPDKSGKVANVNLGFTKLSDYETSSPFFGATAGRYANRIANGKFTLDGKTYSLFVNNGPNSLHGGKKGFDKQIWKAEPQKTASGAAVKLSYVSPDGEEGYPGTLNISCTYTLGEDNTLKYEFVATTDKATVLNIANHSYFNLAGEGNGTILDNILTIDADTYLPTDATQIPTGEEKAVAGTPMDFRKPTVIGTHIQETEIKGYDYNFCLNGGASSTPKFAARVKDPKSGRVMEVWTTQPAVQIYTANHLDGTLSGPSGKPYLQYGAVCLETQHYPDSPNHPKFPTSELKPGETYDQTTILKFSAE